VRAGSGCINAAGIEGAGIDLLVNVGVYRDDNINEPAIASLIQQKLGINLDSSNGQSGSSTFSFDLMNGACGLLYAAFVADALMQSNSVKTALIVSSDAHPSQKPDGVFPYHPAGGAILLQKAPQVGPGLRKIHFRTTDDGFRGIESYCDVSASGLFSRHDVTVMRRKDYIPRLRAFVDESIMTLVNDGSLDPQKLDLVISSQPGPGFAAGIAEAIGMPADTAVDTYGTYGDTHTSALAIGYQKAMEAGLIKDGTRILLIGAGAGLTVACAEYVA
jgi:3-oxoacyl-[acyl-carrier-protein] synthase-3